MDVRRDASSAEPLTESELRYLAVVAALEEGVTVHDAEGRILDANDAAARILGLSPAELVGRTLFLPGGSYVDPTGAPLPAAQHPIHLALSTGEAYERALLGFRTGADADLQWLHMTVKPLAAGEAGADDEGRGRRARAICIFADITFVRAEEEERARTEINFRTIIEQTPDAVAVIQRGQIAYANPRMVGLLGYEDADEMLGRLSVDIVHPDDRATLDQLLRGDPAQPEGAPTQERFMRRDGKPVPVEVTTIPIFYDGDPASLVHARDLTERKRLEAQVLLTDRLASVGRLSAAVGHEINNPLAYVMANLDLALEGLDELRAAPPAEEPEGVGLIAGERLAEMVEMLREAREGADRVRHIVRDLRVFSRGETEERSRLDPRHVLDSCVNMARGEIRQRARLVKRYAATPPVHVNEARLGQVLLNLLVNAAHAIPEGDPEAHEITVSTSTDDRGRVVIEVRDTGAGIPDDVKQRIFEPFFTTKAAGSGTGLGLSICQSIVIAMKGQIAFESEVGKGTAFRVILPAATAG